MASRAQDHLIRIEQALDEKRKEMGVGDDVAAIEKLKPAMLVKLGEAGVKTLDDLGDFASEELVSDHDAPLRDFDLTVDDANEIIMAARAHWFEDEEEAPAAPAEDAAEAGGSGLMGPVCDGKWVALVQTNNRNAAVS